ncbi:hypothetical protein BUALT_Bualt12G0062200 [Buddleja alternifolia]|uniref:FAD-binding PCMH-type domain-containing protein n=1 Tax=Buddleja alternifolia TaxID=168488 RepID=A0AAV6WQN6_9LAMI|nr:hypothetical protein BUALT_Bualt12G0062200 [Buddleja alternifolia]
MGSLITEERIVDSESKEPILYVNGDHWVLPNGLAHLTRLEYLRGGLKWYRPMKLHHVFDLKARYPVGNTEVGIETRLKSLHYPVLIHVAHVPELNQLIIKDEGLEIGASVKFSKLVKILKVVIDERDPFQISSCRSILEQIKWFSGTQRRNVASIGGNIILHLFYIVTFLFLF